MAKPGLHKKAKEKLMNDLAAAKTDEQKKKVYQEYLQFLKEHEDGWYKKLTKGPFYTAVANMPNYSAGWKGERVAKLSHPQSGMPHILSYKINKHKGDLNYLPMREDTSAFFGSMFRYFDKKKTAIEEDQERFGKLLHDLEHPDDVRTESELTTTSKRRTKAQAKKEAEERFQIQQKILRELTEASSRKDELTKSIDGITSMLGSKTKEKGLDEPDKHDVLEYINGLEKEIDAEETLINTKDYITKPNPVRYSGFSESYNLHAPNLNNRVEKFKSENRHIDDPNNTRTAANNLYGDGTAWNGFVLETRKRLKDIKALRKHLLEMKADAIINADTETYLDDDLAEDSVISGITTNPDQSQLTNLTAEQKDDVGNLEDLKDLANIKEQIKRISPSSSRKGSLKEEPVTTKKLSLEEENLKKDYERQIQSALATVKSLTDPEKVKKYKYDQEPQKNQVALRIKDELEPKIAKYQKLLSELLAVPEPVRKQSVREDDLQQIVENIQRSSAKNSPMSSKKNTPVPSRKASIEKAIEGHEKAPKKSDVQQLEQIRDRLKSLSVISNPDRSRKSSVSFDNRLRMDEPEEQEGHEEAKIQEGDQDVNEHEKTKEQILGKRQEGLSIPEEIAIYDEYLDYLDEAILGASSSKEKAALKLESDQVLQKISEIQGGDEAEELAQELAQEEEVPQGLIEYIIKSNNKPGPLLDETSNRPRRQSVQSDIISSLVDKGKKRSLSQSSQNLMPLRKAAQDNELKTHQNIFDDAEQKRAEIAQIYLDNEKLTEKITKAWHGHNIRAAIKRSAQEAADKEDWREIKAGTETAKTPDDQNKLFQLQFHQNLVNKFRNEILKPYKVNNKDRIADKDVKTLAAEKEVLANLANVGERRNLLAEQRRKLGTTYNEHDFTSLRDRAYADDALNQYMKKFENPEVDAHVIEEIRKQNRKVLKHTGFDIATKSLKNGMFLGPSAAVLHKTASDKVERRIAKDIQKYLVADIMRRQTLAKDQIRDDRHDLKDMGKHAQSIEAQLSNEKRLNEEATLKDLQNIKGIGEGDENRAQRWLDLQNQEFYIEQERPKTQLKELAELIHNKGVPTYATPQLRMQIEKRDVPPVYNLVSQAIQSGAQWANNALDSYDARNNKKKKLGGHIHKYATGGSPMGTPEEYKLSTYDPRKNPVVAQLNKEKAQEKPWYDSWDSNESRKWDSFMGGFAKNGVSGAADAMKEHHKDQYEKKMVRDALERKLEESRELQKQREQEWAIKMEDRERDQLVEDRRLGQTDTSLGLQRDRFNFEKGQSTAKTTELSSEESALVKELQKKSMKSKSWTNPFDDTQKQAQQALKLINAGVPPMEALQRAQGISSASGPNTGGSSRKSKAELLSAVGG